MQEKILIIDFGSQYTQLIARRVRELEIFCEIHPYHHLPLIDESVKGIILSGSPFSVHQNDSPRIDLAQWRKKIPILGICYGAQLMAHVYGGSVVRSEIREYGRAKIRPLAESGLLKGVSESSQVWMSHGDSIQSLPDNFEAIARTESIPVAAYQIKDEPTFGLQFHPEVTHSLEGKTILANFLLEVCQCKADWTPAAFVEDTVAQLEAQLGSDKVVLGLSGGVDSSVAALLLHKAIGKNLYCVFVDNGLLRKDEFAQVVESYRDLGLNVIAVDAKADFYAALAQISDPEAKRKAIGKVFIDVFQAQAQSLSDIKWLGQGTIYPDVIESVSVKGPSVTIKSHHNVGGLPEKMNLKIVEPLRMLFKDEVRKVGAELGLPTFILNRHPFPGPGLAIRILGDITPEKVAVLQQVDAIFIEGLKAHNLYSEVWQAGAILLPVQSVGVMGDERTYENAVALRAVTSTDGMTADWAHLPYDFLAEMSNQIINRVKGVNRVVYDISSKPPATIEWE
ncbi:glutamine-hydrolyzing GMP synthase [Hugenholtzia roseola]|uniref:glutamine-hydrolyzing GMP synthase n=1 Tax=Hugenholtzia roseola TaxID=1002 RepID=UPI0004058A94|nr:glutamine-hydrolyzing GMP synthase [Hugenholtzia roseola]